MGNDYIIKVIDPDNLTGPKIDAIIPGDLALEYLKRTPVTFWNLIAAKFVLENTARILYGVRKFNQGGWCYTARPPDWYVRERVIATFPSHLIFAVYINPMMRVYEWRAEKAAEDDPLCPVGWNDPTRYKGLLWKSTF